MTVVQPLIRVATERPVDYYKPQHRKDAKPLFSFRVSGGLGRPGDGGAKH